jgi:hypothetical protein
MFHAVEVNPAPLFNSVNLQNHRPILRPDGHRHPLRLAIRRPILTRRLNPIPGERLRRIDHQPLFLDRILHAGFFEISQMRVT